MTAMPSTLPPPASLMDAEEFCRLHENHRVELVRGVVVELPMPERIHGFICAKFTRFLDTFVDDNQLGYVISHDTLVKVASDPDTVRGMDVAYISFERMPIERFKPGLMEEIPELIVEVRSPSDAWTDLFAKMEEYLAALVNPAKQALSVYRAGKKQEDFAFNDTLTLPDILPGFELPIRKLFPAQA
jgi:Uma2 family endonuclease